MTQRNTQSRPLSENEAQTVSGAGIVTLPELSDQKPVFIPPRYYTLALGEDGGKYPEESIY